MSSTRPISEYSRQELHDLIWSTPTSKLAADFGISDVAIAKRCKKLNVPRPSRGYWAKVEAGKTPRKVPLPPTIDQAFQQAAQGRLRKTLSLPENSERLLPLATQLLSAINKAKADDYKRTRLQDPALPEVRVSKALADRVAQAFHVLLKELEPLGMRFRKFHGIHHTGYFERHRDRLFLTITEDLIRLDGSKGVVEWQWPREIANPCGYLTFSFRTNQYHNSNTLEWSESAKCPLQKVLAQIVAAVRKHFLDLQERREQEKIESAKRHAEWLIIKAERERQETLRLQQEKQLTHVKTLIEIALAREAALRKAAENWRLSRSLSEFIDVCEARWRSQSAEPTAEQVSWLKWAREIAGAISPFSLGYPDPANDGGFEPELIPQGGPYPPTRNIRLRPSQE